MLLLAALVAFALPDPIMTPGAADPAITPAIFCNHTTRERRYVSAETKSAVLAEYNIPQSQSAYYEVDHLIPLAIGGTNEITNLWPQPWGEADIKDSLEVELQRRVCHGLLSLKQAQHEIADDWLSAASKYLPEMLR